MVLLFCCKVATKGFSARLIAEIGEPTIDIIVITFSEERL